MNLNLYGKNALVCGSSKGIGKAAAIQLASLGASVTLVSRSPEKMSAVIKLMDMDISKGQDHNYLVADFTDQQELIKKVRTLSLSKTYHILINNTGGPAGGNVLDAQPMDFIQAINNHLICNQLLTQLLVPGMKKATYGRIINIISISVKVPIPGLGVSNTTRGAVASWAKTLAGELGPHGITVNNVLPGFTETERLKELYGPKAEAAGVSYESYMQGLAQSIPANRIGDPLEVGAAVAFLASPIAGYINGINLPVDGGRVPSL